MPRYGVVSKGHTIPYGALVGASKELRSTYYTYGYLHDEDMPNFPRLPLDTDEPCIDPEEELFKKEAVMVVAEILDSITPAERKVLCMRFGIGTQNNVDHTLEEIGYAFRVTRERIRQIEAKALRKLKHPDRSGVLRELIGGYKTTVDKESEVAILQREWWAAREKLERIRKAEMTMPLKKKELWRELKPALQDAAWVTDLKTSKPDMYQELKDLVGHLWGESAEQIWNMHTERKKHG